MNEKQEGPVSTDHPDEGTIHAWLDGALGDAESARLSAHVASCSRCASEVAEARGLIAGASRVVSALDVDAGPRSAGQVPAWGATPTVTRVASVPAWRRFRVTPARAAIAATLLVVAGLTLTRDWDASESTLPPGASRVATGGPGVASNKASLAAPTRDPLLDSAVRRHVQEALPPRVIERAPGPVVAAAPDVPLSPVAVDAAAPMRVASGRAVASAQRDTAPVPVPAEHALAAVVAPARVADAGGAVAGRAMSMPMAKATSAPRSSAESTGPSELVVGQCYRIESATPGAMWGSVPLPIVVALQGSEDAGSGPVRLLGGTTQDAENGRNSRWTRLGADSIRIDLRRIGYNGSMRIARMTPSAGGTMRSSINSAALSEIVVTGVGAESGDVGGRAKAATAAAATPAPAVAISARRVACQ